MKYYSRNVKLLPRWYIGISCTIQRSLKCLKNTAQEKPINMNSFIEDVLKSELHNFIQWSLLCEMTGRRCLFYLCTAKLHWRYLCVWMPQSKTFKLNKPTVHQSSCLKWKKMVLSLFCATELTIYFFSLLHKESHVMRLKVLISSPIFHTLCNRTTSINQ